MDRRALLKTGCLGLTGLAIQSWPLSNPEAEGTSILSGFHPLTRQLLVRLQRASIRTGPVDWSGLESLIVKESLAQGWSKPPIIKWRADPSEAFAYLSSYGLDALLQMENAGLWRRAGLVVDLDDDRLNSHLVLGGVIAKIAHADECSRVLLAPKLLSKSRAIAESASEDAIFGARVIGAQIGWLETCIPALVSQAITNIELLLCSGAPERSIHHQLRVFEAYELGLLATWETSDAVVCIPQTGCPEIGQ